MTQISPILYTITDEAPFLATQSLLPIVQAFAKAGSVAIETRDISLAGRIKASFQDFLTDAQKQSDDLMELGELVKKKGTNIIKLPNISASIPQLKTAIAELITKGYAVPEFPETPVTPEQQEIKARYAKILGSAVNPVLREGNSDRRIPEAVKEYAKQNPHSMGTWSPDSKTAIHHMDQGDFFGSEQSVRIENDTQISIEFFGNDQSHTVLKQPFSLLKNEIIDSSVMSVAVLDTFYAESFALAKKKGALLSLHLKASMMKVSDPIMFGHAVSVYFKELFKKHAETFTQLGIDPSLGFGDIKKRIATLPDAQQKPILETIERCFAEGPELAMVNSDLGITNLDVPSDVIIDASLPAMIRAGGKMWGLDGALHDTIALVPDRSYAGIFRETVDFCREHGAFDVTTMGNVANIGLMAQKAEEYGSHDKTFKMAGPGIVRVIDASGQTLMESNVETGDIWRMCQTKDVAVQDWIAYAITRVKTTGTPAIFWLDTNRAHDAQIISRVETYLKTVDTTSLDIQILPPEEACKVTLERSSKGLDTISVTGNVLRDYLTDLFPIIEVGTSAKMLSIVPLLDGGTLFETGAGGSAPKHVQQFTSEGHLRWDSLGEFLAIAESLETYGDINSTPGATILSNTLKDANARILNERRSPSPKVNEIDNRGSHYFLARYWAEALAAQTSDTELQKKFAPIAQALIEGEAEILAELLNAQGAPIDLDGYYLQDSDKVRNAMRPSALFNSIIEAVNA